MAKVATEHELSERDYDQLAHVLSRVIRGKIANLEALDGFLTALAINPELIKPSEFIPVIISGATEDGNLIFDSIIEAEGFSRILVRYWNTINKTFQGGELHFPYLIEDEDGNVRAIDWANGFLAATHLRFEAWAEIVNDEKRSGPFVPIWALAHENAEDLGLRPFKEPVSTEKREQLIAGMIAGARAAL